MSNKSIDYSILRYACCWEDARLLRTAMQVQPGDTVASVASAGDNTLLLLADGPARLIACDLNEVQLHLLELKKAGFLHLTQPELVAFLGYTKYTERLRLYKILSPHLSAEARRHWDSKTDDIEAGLIFSGKFERYLRLFGLYVRPLVNSSAMVHELIRPKTAGEQEVFFNAKWKNFRWRMLMRLFFSKALMSRLGRSKGMMEEVQDSGSDILERAENHFKSVAAQQSYFLEFIMDIEPLAIPPYLQPDVFEKIKANLPALHLWFGGIDSIPESYGQIDAWNLSNIFEYMPQPDFVKCTDAILFRSRPGSRLAYWNLFKERNMQLTHKSLETINADASNDAGFFYRKFFSFRVSS
ncbi:MAG: DUF3419 family protein [Bacteroidota bacterium]